MKPKAARSKATAAAPRGRIEIHPLTPDRWPDLVELFGPNGACAGCWCTYPRSATRELGRSHSARNRRALQRIVDRGPPPGLLAYRAGKAVGWCAVAPRSDYPRLARSRVLAPVDDQPVWSIVCFFVARAHRGQGITARLARAAAAWAAGRGARIIEGYPVASRSGRQADAWMWHGAPSAFARAGFREVARRSATRPIMRRRLRASASRPSRG